MKRTGEKDLLSKKMVTAEEFVMGSKQVIVYKFSWVMFLNVLEQRKKTRNVIDPATGEPIDHNSTTMPADSVARCFENVRMSIVDKAIQYALSDDAARRSRVLCGKEDGGFLEAEYGIGCEWQPKRRARQHGDLTDEQKTADEVFRQMKSSYFTQSEGVRADHCRM